jgi:hypothetical protein
MLHPPVTIRYLNVKPNFQDVAGGRLENVRLEFSQGGICSSTIWYGLGNKTQIIVYAGVFVTIN